MAQQTYDPDADQKYTQENLRKAEEAATQDGYDREFNDNASNYGDTAEHPLGDREASASGEAVESPSKDKHAAEANDSVNFTGDGSKKKGFRARLRNMSTARKWVLIGAGTGGIGLIGMLVLLFLLASSLMIPNLMQNITTYQFARLTRQYAESATRVTEEKLAADALDDASWKTQVKEKYQNLRESTWGKFDKYRPEKVMQNLKGSDRFQITYQRTSLGRLQLKGVTLLDRTYLPVQRNALQRYTPGLSSVLEAKDNISFAKQVQPALDAALRLQDTGPIVRASVAKSIRQELGIGLVAWTLAKYQGKGEAAARLEEARQKAATVDEKNPVNDAKTSTISETVSDTEQAAENTLKDDKLLQETIDNGGVSQSVKAALAKGLEKSGLQTAVSIANPVYGVAMPACIVYDGSLDHSGNTIDTQTNQQVRQYNYLQSAAHQQQAGTQNNDPTTATELGVAIRATNDDLGDISDTNAMKRGSGQSIDTSQYVSPEASAGGEYTLLDATPGLSAVAGPLNAIADEACPVLTNIWGGIGLGILNIGIAILSGGSSAAGEEAAGQAATQVIEHTATNLFDRLITNTIGKAATKVSRLRDILYDTGKSSVKIAAATVIAKLIVSARAGDTTGGFNQGQTLADGADSGGGIYAGMIEQKELYGRPMTAAEVAQSDVDDKASVARMNGSRSVFERYLATDNAFSLISRMAMGVNSNANSSIFHSLTNMASLLMRPLTYFGALFTGINGKASALSDQHYGNVQFGWSNAEENLIDSTPSYRNHLDNQTVLDASGKQDEISSKYNDCFTESIGSLLQDGKIRRDTDGNVIADQGLCAPNNLGPNNSDYGDLVFRYRIAMSSNNTVDQLVGDQEVTADANATNSAGSTAGASGDSATLAQQILDNANITLQKACVTGPTATPSGCALQDIQATAQGQKVTPGRISGQSNGSASTGACSARTPVTLDPVLLQGMLNLAAKYKYFIQDIDSGHDCDSGRHPMGRAFDVTQVNGKPINGCADPQVYQFMKDAANIMSDLIPTGTYPNEAGIGSCVAGSKPSWVPGNINYFTDASDEIHIDTGEPK